jgi:hypothetical protein
MTVVGYLALAYLSAGLVFAVAFAAKGCVSVDERAGGSGIVFRLMIVPAAVLLWPYLLHRWRGGPT